MSTIPTNLKLADRNTTYKVYACEPCKEEAVAVPIRPDSTGKATEIIIVCPNCLVAGKTTMPEFQEAVKAKKVGA